MRTFQLNESKKLMDEDGKYYENNENNENNEVKNIEQGYFQDNGQDEDTTDTETKEKKEDSERQFNVKDYEGIVFTQCNIVCNVQEKAGVPSSWILLDSQSTGNVFCDLNIPQNVREAK